MEPTDALPKRWSAIEGYSPNASGVVSLARLFYSLGSFDEEFHLGFQTAFQTADPPFKMSGNENELSVLAGAELIDLIDRGDTGLADLAALSLVCAAGANLRPPPRVKRIPELAAKYLSERTLGRWTIQSDDEIESAESALGSLAAAQEPFPLLAKHLRTMQRQLDLVREESNMLWWLFSDFSRDQQTTWSKVPFAAVPVVAGKELSDLTGIIPGPTAARAFLDRVIHSAKSKPPVSILITDAINNLPAEWRTAYSRDYCTTETAALQPITLGIKLSLSAPENNAWLPAFARGTLLPSGAKIAPNILAHQVFLEAMLCRAWRQAT
jgi:hypothetical protein